MTERGMDGGRDGWREEVGGRRGGGGREREKVGRRKSTATQMAHTK